MRERFCNYLLILGQMPLPVEDFGHILTDLVDVVLGGNQLVVHLLNQISALVAQLGQMQQGILHQIILKICVYRIVLYSSKLYAPNRNTAPKTPQTAIFFRSRYPCAIYCSRPTQGEFGHGMRVNQIGFTFSVLMQESESILIHSGGPRA